MNTTVAPVVISHGPGKCEICAWPIDTGGGCKPGDCCYRPSDPAEQRLLQARRDALAQPGVVFRQPTDYAHAAPSQPLAREQHLLLKLAEECAEVTQRVTKALRFGLAEVQPGQTSTNADRLVDEMMDLFAAYQMLVDDGVIERVHFAGVTDSFALSTIKKKVERFLLYSLQCGTLTEANDGPPVLEDAGD